MFTNIDRTKGYPFETQIPCQGAAMTRGLECGTELRALQNYILSHNLDLRICQVLPVLGFQRGTLFGADDL